MGPLRIRVLSLESKLTPHARPVVDRRDGTFGKVPNLIFPPLPFGLRWFFLVSPAAAFPGAVAADHARPLVQAPGAPQQCLFLMLF